jgi:YfiH family protein
MALSANLSIDPPLDRYRDALLTSSRLSAIPELRHGITGRIPGLDPAEANIGYGSPRDKDAAWAERQLWCRAAGIDPMAVSTVHQIHGRDVVQVNVQDRGRGGPLGSTSLGQADALMTNAPGVSIMTLHADCLPIILVDPDALAVCVIHSGWRGTVADIPGASIEAMVKAYGADPGRIIAMIGPGIRSCCYEVGDEVIAEWREMAGDAANRAIEAGPRRWHLDLPNANRWLLMRAGIEADNIDDLALCTRCHGERWFSHRGQGPETGRFAAMVGIAPARNEESDSWL